MKNIENIYKYIKFLIIHPKKNMADDAGYVSSIPLSWKCWSLVLKCNMHVKVCEMLLIHTVCLRVTVIYKFTSISFQQPPGRKPKYASPLDDRKAKEKLMERY